jgi:cytochrome c oxidase cbb3-type subunit 3
MVGALLIVGVFVVSFNPFRPKPQAEAAAAVAEVEDWTEPAPSAIVFSTAQADIDQGKLLFASKCSVCHGKSGEGEIGPNLLDNYWKYGGSPQQIYSTITNGVEATTMVPWKEKITPKKRLQLLAYLESMKGKVEGTAPEGEEYIPAP